jgi:hypothetical protein
VEEIGGGDEDGVDVRIIEQTAVVGVNGDVRADILAEILLDFR